MRLGYLRSISFMNIKLYLNILRYNSRFYLYKCLYSKESITLSRMKIK